MYYYIYDSFLSNKKYESVLRRIETRLMDLGINGKTEKLTLLKNMGEIVEDAAKKGSTTIIAVGNDKTVSKIIGYLPNYNVILGIIPIGSQNRIAQILDIPPEEKACDVLSARIIEKVDLGKVNNSYFLSYLEIPSKKELTLECDQYTIVPLSEDTTVNICNFGNILDQNKLKEKIYNPRDGIFEAVISKKTDSWSPFKIFKKSFSESSVFPIKKIKIKCSKECIPIIADGQATIKTPVTVEVMPKKLKIIVGKNRMF